jgi:hypothetical protein
MVSAIVSLILAVLSLVAVVPVVLPVIGLALGANSIIKEKRKDQRNKAILIIASIAIIANGFVALMFVLGGHLK